MSNTNEISAQAAQLPIPEFVEIDGAKIYKKYLILFRNRWRLEYGQQHSDPVFKPSDVLDEPDIAARKVMASMYCDGDYGETPEIKYAKFLAYGGKLEWIGEKHDNQSA